MKFDLGKFHKKSKEIFDREGLSKFKHKVVAFVLDSRGHVLTSGWNSYTKSHPEQKKAAMVHSEEFKCYLHAEVHAMTRLTYKQMAKADTIVVMRLGNTKELLPGKPCKICSDVIRDYNIKNIIHS